jgi:Raf kinase inhibitor-like YbhB/YbcL family protein
LADDLVISSSAFADGGSIPASYSCKGENTNPPLTITGVPVEAKSLALMVNDPDAPSGNFVHWLVWDMAANTGTINAHSVPIGAIQGMNDAGNNQYFGPCPPSGTHHYIFTIYALDTTLGLPAATKLPEFKNAIKDHVLAQAELTGLFSA